MWRSGPVASGGFGSGFFGLITRSTDEPQEVRNVTFLSFPVFALMIKKKFRSEV